MGKLPSALLKCHEVVMEISWQACIFSLTAHDNQETPDMYVPDGIEDWHSNTCVIPVANIRKRAGF
jgi:hypothetical protein